MPSAFVALQHIVPQHTLSRLAGRLAASQRPWLRDRLIRRFVAAYDVDLGEAARGIGQFASFNDFFARELKRGARPLADAGAFILSPADGAISQLGAITAGRIVQAKGRDYSVAELLGTNLGTGAAAAARFEGGRFMTIYLSPRDYHRVHMPAAGTLAATAYLPGVLFSVNQATAAGVERLFARKVVSIEQMGTYNCRQIAAYAGWVSQHSFAHAIDIKHQTRRRRGDIAQVAADLGGHRTSPPQSVDRPIPGGGPKLTKRSNEPATRK